MMNTPPTQPIVNTQQPLNPIGASTLQPDIFSMVKTAVQSELSRLGLGNNLSPNQVSPVAVGQSTQQQTQQLLNSLNQNPLNFVLPVIGQAFSKEQQEWISQPQVLMGIPGFLMSSDGKAILNMMYDSYKEFLTKGTENK